MTASGRDIEINPEAHGLGLAIWNGRMSVRAFNNNHPERREPLRLHHYTTTPGVHGILSRGTADGARYMRLTHARFLNDATELEYAGNVFREVGRRHLDQASDDSVRRYCAKVLELLESPLVPDAFVACFSATWQPSHPMAGPQRATQGPEDDRLSQWRGYGGTADVPYALSFNVGVFDHTSPLGAKATGQPVTYTRELQESAAHVILGGFAPPGPVGVAYTDEDLHDLASEAVDEAARVGSFMKHPGFYEENEYRMFVQDVARDDTAFKLSKSGVTVPYIALPLRDDPDSLASVSQGPTLHADLAMDGMRRWLDRHGYESVPLTRTEIPLRQGL